MPKLGTTGPDGSRLPDDVIARVGAACGQVAAIQHTYSPRIASAPSDREKADLRQAATAAAVRAISDQGLTVAEYNEVITAAQVDPDLEERLLEAASLP